MDKSAAITAVIAELQDASIATFVGKNNQEIMRLERNGDIFVHGKLVENDKQVVDGLRDFLLAQGF